MKIYNDQNFLEYLKINAEEAFSKLEFDYYAVCLIKASDYGVCNALPAVHVTNYPKDWTEYYVANQLHYDDPVMHFGRLVSYPTSWSSLTNASGFSDAHRAVLDRARDFNVYSGVCMSIHNLDCSLLLVSMACTKERNLTTTLMKDVAETVQSLSEVVRPPRQHSPSSFDLTEREVECLRWCSLGKTSSDISAIMEISTNTVDFHLKSAMRKLSTNNRTFTIVKAMRNGIISL